MSTRVGVVAEGPIDQILIAPLLRSVAKDRAAFNWQVDPADAALDWLKMRPRGHGGVWLAVKRMVKVLEQTAAPPYAFIVILLDRRTKAIQRKVRKLIAGKDRFILATAQEEIEAWWLGDRTSTLAWLGFEKAPDDTVYGRSDYVAERDKEPKRTLDDLTRRSSRLDRVYGEGNVDLARDFAAQWEQAVNLKEIESQCPQRFPLFCDETRQAFVRTKSREGYLV